jgi:hypothetical protein
MSNLKVSEMKTIIVEKLDGIGGYKAYIKDNSEKWEYGKSRSEALAQLFISLAPSLGYEIVNGY